MKRTRILIVLGTLVIVTLLAIRISRDWPYNIAAVQVVKHIQPIEARCAPLDARWAWSGASLPANLSANLQAVAGSLDALDTTETAVDRQPSNPPLLAWFRALQLARQGHAEESMPYFKLAGAGQAFLAAGHKTYFTDSACTVFNWILAYEIGNVSPSPDPPFRNVTLYVEDLIANGKAKAVIDAYTRLLAFEPNNSDWRLTLAKAYLTLRQKAMAEQVLHPLLSSPEGRAVVDALLNKYQQ